MALFKRAAAWFNSVRGFPSPTNTRGQPGGRSEPVTRVWIGEADKFLSLTIQSGLVTEETLQTVMRDYHRGNPMSSRFGDNVTAVSGYLVSRGILTCWQVGKLREGKHKGFHFEGYWLLDELEQLATNAVFLASKGPGTQIVKLEILPYEAAGQQRKHREIEIVRN